MKTTVRSSPIASLSQSRSKSTVSSRRRPTRFEMKTCPKKTKKDSYIKDCKEQPRKILLVKEQIYYFEPKKIYELEMKKFPNSFFRPTKEQIHCFEQKKFYELEMRTCPEKAKKDSHIKDCKEQPREILPVKEQIHRFEPKKIYELEVKTRPKKNKKDGYIKDCKEQPREIYDQ